MTDGMETASRFLMMSTLGAGHGLVRHVAETGTGKWLDQQLNTPVSPRDSFQSEVAEIWRYFREKLLEKHGEAALNGDGNNPALPYKWYFRMGWWQRFLSLQDNSPHHIRHRVAQALSEILVISDNSILELDAVAMGGYYDILYRHAFGSYRDMLEEVSLHPCMGAYLSHMNNRKADPARNIHPDENYAREIMQLFTIGLYELNPDGSRKQGGIPTYDNGDIREMARIFTGLKASKYQYEWPGDFFPYSGQEVEFDDDVDKTQKMPPFVNMTRPMVMDQAYHDTGAKNLLNGRIDIAAGQNGLKDIRDAIEALVAHPSTAPFLSRKLIQQLVTSNPSGDYVRDVAAAFGMHGDMKAVIRTILTHPEAKQPQKLKSPLLRATQVLKAFGTSNDNGKFWITGEFIKDSISQHPLSSPTVFNFYKPDFAPHGPIEDKGLVAPEFELQNAATSVAYINMMYAWIMGEFLPLVSTRISASLNNVPEQDAEHLYADNRSKLRFDLSEEVAIATDPSRHDELIERISLIMTGKRDIPIKREIREAFQYYTTEPLWVVQTIIFLISVSADYTVLEA